MKRKYKNQTCYVDGIKFPSRLEAEVYIYLKHEEKQGCLKILDRQVTVVLTKAKIRYRPDFKIQYAHGPISFVEAKGVETERFKLIKQLWRVYGPEPLEIFKKKNGRIQLVECIDVEP